MSPLEFNQKQIELYRNMSGEERLLIGLRLHELACEVSRSAIRSQFPSATADKVEEKLKHRLRLAYRINEQRALSS